jgi:diguanylate cyclase (GGDEF)-like protein
LIARLLQDAFTRNDDTVFRYGGEEFVVIARGPDYQHARLAFERLRSNVDQYQFPQLEKLTVGIGFVSASSQLTSTALLGQAAQALY